MKNKSKSLKVNILWSVIGGLFFSLMQWIIIILLNKFSTLNNVGNFSFVVSFVTPFFVFFSLQLKEYQSTDSHSSNTYSEYFILRSLTNLCTIISVFVVSFIFFETSVLVLIILFTIIRILESYSDIFFGKFQLHGLMNIVGTSRILKSLIIISVFYILLTNFTDSLEILFFTQIVVYIVILIFYERLNYNKKFKKIQLQSFKGIDWLNIKKLLIITMPLSVIAVIDSLNVLFPRLILDYFFGKSVLGIYTSLTYFYIFGATLLNIVGLPLTTELSKKVKDNNYIAFKKILYIYLSLPFIISIVGSLTVLLFGEAILTLVYSAEISQHYMFLLLSLGLALIYYLAHVLYCALLAMRVIKQQLKLYLLILIVLLFMALLVIPFYGMIGALITTFAGYTIRLIGYIVIYFNLVKKVFNQTKGGEVL